MNGIPIPRPEYPRPQFVREDWINLNGVWTFEFDFGCTGIERNRQAAQGFDHEIVVPFCPESKLSGVGYTDFIAGMLYHRKINIPERWNGKRILLHFGGVDYKCVVFIDGHEAGRHIGGSTSFEVDITDFAAVGTHDLVLAVEDDTRSGVQPVGKQSQEYRSWRTHYSRVTGIWQTVWLEAVAEAGLKSCRIVPDLDRGAFGFIPQYYAARPGCRLEVKIRAEGRPVGSILVPANTGIPFDVELSETIPWEPERPFLYDIEFVLRDPAGNEIDRVRSYAGLRKIHIEGNRFFLNNREIFQRLVLDQGFYPDGIWTAPSDADLRRDIEISLACGFNGARLHQKIFEERFLYWADKLGYLVWGEFPCWGLNCNRIYRADVNIYEAVVNFAREWEEEIERDFSHPAIIAWCPFNENMPFKNLDIYREYMTFVYDFTKKLDPTRPVNDTSGYVHVKTDLYSVHLYCRTAEDLRNRFNLEPGKTVSRQKPEEDCEYRGQPFLNDEFGGFKYLPPGRAPYAPDSWGYHNEKISSPEELCAKIREQVDLMLEMDTLAGYCYTQLTDVEQEENGLVCYDRTPKVDFKALAGIFGRNPKRFQQK